MNYVFRINEELASVSVTAIELLSVTSALNSTVKNADFLALFNNIVSEINQSYAVLTNSFSPFLKLDSEESFIENFDMVYQDFKGNYLLEVSKPRKYCEDIYESYVELKKTKEAKSNYPALKRSFSRLDALYDKWISNDNYLGMSIDGAIKHKNQLLVQIAELKGRDEEDAWNLLHGSFDDFRPLLEVIDSTYHQIKNIVGAN